MDLSIQQQIASIKNQLAQLEDTIHVSRVYVDYDKAMERVNLIEKDHEELMNML